MVGNIQVRLAQIAQKTHDYFYLPYSVGLLQAYAQQHLFEPEAFTFLPPLYRRMTLEEGLREFEKIQIAGFSVYVWNIRRSLRIAEALKRAQPETLIVFGGPQVPDRAESFLRQHSFIDLCTHGAGEALFTQILESYQQSPETQGRALWGDLEGVSYFAEGDFQYRAPAPRTRDLSAYPSPFLSGVFDPLLQEHRKWFSTWETNRGCPFRCAFCDWGSAIASKVARFDMERIEAEAAWFGRNKINSIFCADANFGMLKRDVEIAQWMAAAKARFGYPRLFQIQTAKNVNTRVLEIQTLLKQAQMSSTAAISVQSLSPEVLKNIQRENISQAVFQSIQEACLERQIYTYTEVIVGLPGETYSSFAEGINTILENGQLNKILFHNAAILPNAEMAQPEYRQKHGLQTVLVPMPYQRVVPGEADFETLEIIIGSASFSLADWQRIQVFAWMTSFLIYHHKMLQLVFLLLHDTLKVSFRKLIELFVLGDVRAYPHLHRLQSRMFTSAALQQQGLPHCLNDELVQSPSDGRYLTPAFLLQEEAVEKGGLEFMMMEAAAYLARFARAHQPDYPLDLLKEAFVLNRRVFEKMYQREQPLPPEFLNRRHTQSNLAHYFKSRLQGEQISIHSLVEMP